MYSVPNTHKTVLLNLQECYAILRCLNRKAELRRLIQWAARKRLPEPLVLYTNRLTDEELRLSRYTLHYPSMVKWLTWFHRFNYLIIPSPRYYKRGSAAYYRHRKLDKTR